MKTLAYYTACLAAGLCIAGVLLFFFKSHDWWRLADALFCAAVCAWCIRFYRSEE